MEVDARKIRMLVFIISYITRLQRGLPSSIKLLKVFVICETVDLSSDIHQPPLLTKIRVSLQMAFMEFINI